jgi:hypothetical protein
MSSELRLLLTLIVLAQERHEGVHADVADVGDIVPVLHDAPVALDEVPGHSLQDVVGACRVRGEAELEQFDGVVRADPTRKPKCFKVIKN